MQFSQKEWVGLIFRKDEQQDLENDTLDIGLKNVYWAIDGVRSLSDIAVEDRYDLQDLIGKVRQLLQLELVQISSSPGATIDKVFFDFISDLLARELGPIGEIILDETVSHSGHQRSGFPANKVPKLVADLALEFGDAGRARAFKEKVAAELKKMKTG